MVRAGITTPDDLSAKRPYIIVGAFVVGMLLTPPDAFSQTLLAVPMWLLFEVGLRLSRRFMPAAGVEDGARGGEDAGTEGGDGPPPDQGA
jgi:sec-independent protein translocase protein TatC